MRTDGTYEFYEFIWNGVSDGWGIYSYPPMNGVEVSFKAQVASALEMKVIREQWPRLAQKSVTETKKILGGTQFTFGKWELEHAKSVCSMMRMKRINCQVVDVPDYMIINFQTHEVAQIRCQETYDQVADKLIEKGCQITPHSGTFPVGAIACSDEE